MTAASVDGSAPAWILSLEVLTATSAQLTDWLVRIMMAALDAPGFVNAEIIPPPDKSSREWTLVHRFDLLDRVGQWDTSSSLRSLLQEVEVLVKDQSIIINKHWEADYKPVSNVATAIVTHVKPGKETEFRRWIARIHTAQAQSTGYRGTFLQPPPNNGAPWTTLLRFDSAKTLDSWIDSKERQDLLVEAQDFQRFDVQRLISVFPGWFPTDPVTGKSPPRWKTGMLVLLVLFPFIMLCNAFVRPFFTHLPVAVATFVGNVISVSITSMLMMPLATKSFSFWLFPGGLNPRLDNIKGYAIVLIGYALELGIAICLSAHH